MMNNNKTKRQTIKEDCKNHETIGETIDSDIGSYELEISSKPFIKDLIIFLRENHGIDFKNVNDEALFYKDINKLLSSNQGG